MAREFLKDPDAVLDYQFDWSDWLAGDTITAATVTAASGLTVDSTTFTASAVTVWLSGGSENAAYSATCHVTTAAGREDDRTVTITVTDR